MILSMTGFGEASLEQPGHAYHVEIRSVNNRYFKLTVRLPEGMEFLEAELESVLRRRLTRGSVTLRVHYRDLSADAAQEINVAAIEQYLARLAPLLKPPLTIDVATLAMLPGVVQPHEISENLREEIVRNMTGLTEQAIDALLSMRKIEGGKLAEDLRRHCQIVHENLAHIETQAPQVIRDYRERLLARVRELLAHSGVELAGDDLLKEVSIFAERSDISEEISRLRSHLEQFDGALASTDPAGRRLDFISQEMLREANTIGSKAGDATIARHTIEIKAAIDRIKEQVQNAE